MNRIEFEKYLDKLLCPEEFEDYCPNGLQIEGKENLKTVVFALSASFESIDFAVKNKACALVVHHGLFWKFHGTKKITGPFYKRISPLIKNDINLYAYHLPLDAHLEFGNAATLAKLIGLLNIEPFGQYKKNHIGVKGRFNNPTTGAKLKEKLESVLSHPIIHARPTSTELIHTVGIITGGANSEWTQAHAAGLDAYITGEISEHDWHEASEAGVHMFAGGHHATERPGIIALMDKINETYPSLKTIYFESENPA